MPLVIVTLVVTPFAARGIPAHMCLTMVVVALLGNPFGLAYLALHTSTSWCNR